MQQNFIRLYRINTFIVFCSGESHFWSILDFMQSRKIIFGNLSRYNSFEINAEDDLVKLEVGYGQI